MWNCSLAECDYILQGDMETWTAPQTIYSPADVPRSAGKVPQPRSYAPSRLAEDHQLDKGNRDIATLFRALGLLSLSCPFRTKMLKNAHQWLAIEPGYCNPIEGVRVIEPIVSQATMRKALQWQAI